MRFANNLLKTIGILKCQRMPQPGISLISSPYYQRLRLSRPLSSEEHRRQEPQPPPQRFNRNFISNFYEKIQEEMKRNKELQENKKQLEERLKALNDSAVRHKYDKITKESAESTELIKHRLNEFADYMNSVSH